MGWNNPAVPWARMRRLLDDGEPLVEDALVAEGRRPRLVVPTVRRPGTVPYAELHCHTNFSFLDGASSPEEIVEEAARLGLEAVAITDHDGFYGVVRFAERARELGMPTVFGAELSLDLTGPQNGRPDPAGRHLLVLARGEDGYRSLAAAIGEAQLAGGEKGNPQYDLDRLAEAGRGDWMVLTGCRKGPVPAALLTDGVPAARRELDRLVALFGRANVAVELTNHGDPLDGDRNDALAELAARAGLPVVATNNVHYHAPRRFRLATVLAAVRARRSLDELDGWFPAAPTAHLRSGEEMAQWMRRYPTAVPYAAELGRQVAFDLKMIAPKLPPFACPDGGSEISYLRELTMAGAQRRYGPAAANPGAYRQIEHELAIIGQLEFPGYFLVVWEIVDFCRREGIFCQGRGSAANSAVCYALGITNVDAVAHGLLFERFLAPERDGPPDIDIDIESDRREEVIQHVYRRYGRRYAAQVANVISYRPKSAVRDVAKALGYSPGQQDAWARRIDQWRGAVADDDIPRQVVDLANGLMTFPRHLGIHSGGMVICDQPISQVCPVEWGRMAGPDGAPLRSVLQWDKDDCADAGLVKFDLLGLGMLSALRYSIEFIAEHHGEHLDLAFLPQEDPEVYQMLGRADSTGLFQVESRAQMATLPRIKPVTFYDLVVEVALIRPGPIQGGAVHPYIERRKGGQSPAAAHPLLENALSKTLGIPLFQEQLMQMAIDVAGFTPAESDQLRRAMGSKRSAEKMAEIRDRFFAGMAARGITGELADSIYSKIEAFANFGFPESHAISFAYLVYASAWFKRYYPAAFCAALLKAQPMGFYSPQTLVDDARRHGVTVLRPCIHQSDVHSRPEPRPDRPPPRRAGRDDRPSEWGKQGPEVRLGLAGVRNVGAKIAERIVAARAADGPFRDLLDVARRCELTAAHLEALATAGAFDTFGISRRAALWAAGPAARETFGTLPGVAGGVDAPMLPGMDALETTRADVWATGLSPDSHPVQYVRDHLDARGAIRIGDLVHIEHERRVAVGGIVTHRQRPETAGGVIFINLEDETGMLNVICLPRFYESARTLLRTHSAMLIRGRLERIDGAASLVAEVVYPLRVPIATKSRDFR